MKVEVGNVVVVKAEKSSCDGWLVGDGIAAAHVVAQ